MFLAKRNIDRVFSCDDYFVENDLLRLFQLMPQKKRKSVTSTPELFSVSFDVPGSSADDVSIDILERLLTVKATRKTQRDSEDADIWHYADIPHDVDPDTASAELKNGVITVSFARAAAKKRKRIEIKAV